MSKHSRRSEHVQAGRGRLETGVTDKPPEAEAGDDSPTADGVAPDHEPVGKYWVVIVLWTVAFVLLIAYEAIAAIFRG